METIRIGEDWSAKAPHERLLDLRAQTSGRVVFTTSFGIEDQALTHLIANSKLDIDIVTLDTGRLFQQTYDVWRATEQRYDLRIRAFYPAHEDVEALVARQGIDGFYQSVDKRHACCDVRKVRPLSRALNGAKAWISGLRASQSEERQTAEFVTFDATRDLLKANPLLDWSRDNVVAFIQANSVPVNALHTQGFPSIGCAPCTRAIEPWEDERAGRWWWETSNKECGLHVGPDGRLVRAGAATGASA